jgi:hypothetical protein
MCVGSPAAFGRALLFFLACHGPALAGDAPVRADLTAPKNRSFFFSGLDVGGSSVFAWAGIGAAPFGHLEDDGLRIRIFGGTGRYRYRTVGTASGRNESDVGAGEILIGFHRSLPNAGVTFYLGPQIEHQRAAEPDPGNMTGAEFGLKAAIELHARLDPLRLINASASASTVKRAYHARAALLREVSPALAIGFEAAVYGDARYLEPRGGVFVSTKRGNSVLAVSAGVLAHSDKGNGAFVTLSLYTPY